MAHCTEDELTLYYYGESKRADRIEQHLQQCEPCAAAYRSIAGTLGLVGGMEPPARDERYGLEVWQRIRHDLPPQESSWPMRWSSWYRPAMAASVAVMIIAAFAAGRSMRRQAPSPQELAQAQNLADLRVELREMRQMLTLSLMQQQSATERLRGVSGSVQIDQPDNEIVRALLDTLMHDPNVNVRLAAVDALRRFSQRDVVRQGTIQALADSSFPLVQIALIDFMVETRERAAIEALQRLAQDAAANEAVRGRAAWGVEQLNL
jgi:hypothetical protein